MLKAPPFPRPLSVFLVSNICLESDGRDEEVLDDGELVGEEAAGNEVVVGELVGGED